MKNSPSVNLEQKLNKYFPSLFLLMKDEQFSWNKINKKFDEVFAKRKAEYVKNNNYLKVEASFFDVITLVLNGNDSAERFLTFSDNIFKELSFRVPDNQKNWLKTTLFSLLTNWDRNYRNFIGELAVLNNFLKSSFVLQKVEYRLANGKDIDFLFSGSENGRIALIEVLNIHLENLQEKTDDQIIRFYQRKINDKLIDKSKNKISEIEFHLIPVVWGTYQELYTVYSLYKTGAFFENKNVMEPSSYICYDLGNEVKYYFGRLSTFPSWPKP